MAVRIRMTRAGSKRKPFYRFVVIDSSVQRDGGFLDLVGQYNPLVKPYDIKVDEAKISAWLRKGATLSDGVRSLLKKTGSLGRIEAGRSAAGAAVGGEAQPTTGAEGQAGAEGAEETGRAEEVGRAEETQE